MTAMEIAVKNKEHRRKHTLGKEEGARKTPEWSLVCQGLLISFLLNSTG